MSDLAPASAPIIPAALPPATPEMHQTAPECTIPANREIPPAQLNTPTPRALTEKHRIALDMLVAGEPLHLICFRLRIDRSTLYRWKHHHPRFIAELNRRHQELWSDFAADLRLSVAKAIRAVDGQLSSHRDTTQLRAARALIHLVNTDRISPKNAPTRLDDVLDTFLRAAQPLTALPAPKGAPEPPAFTDAQRQAVLDHLLAQDAAAESARQVAAAARSALHHQRRQQRNQQPSLNAPTTDSGQSTTDNGQLATDQ